MDKLQLEVLLKAIDQVTAPLKSITGASGETAKAVREAKGALKELEQQQGLVDKFRDTSKWVGITGNQLKAAQEKVRELKLEMDATDEPTKKMVRAFEAAKKEAGELKDKHGELIAKQQTLRAALGESGISTTDLAAHQKRLKTDIAAATGEVDRQSAALAQHNEKMRAINAAQAEYSKTIELRNKLATGGAVTMATGAAMGAPFLAASREFGDFEQAMMGVAKQMEGARDANGNITQSYHEMARAIKAMSEEIPMAANEIAAIVEAGARMGIQGKENLLTYARQTAIMSSALDLSVEQTGMNMATIAGLYKVPIANIKELGDTINWLDENARSNSGDIIDVMKRVAGTMSGVMDYRQTAALASTFLSLGARAEVAASATNAMVRELSVANMQADRFQDGMKMLKLDSQEIQSGMKLVTSNPEEQTAKAAREGQSKARGATKAPEVKPTPAPRVEVGKGGVFYIGTKVDPQSGATTELPPMWLAEKMEILGRGVDEGNEHYRILRWHSRGNGQEQNRAINLGIVGERECWKTLRAGGLPIASSRRALEQLAGWLQTGGEDTMHTVSHRGGWNLGAYVLPSGEIIGEPTSPLFYNGDRSHAPAYQARGSVESWREHVASLCNGNSRPMLAIGAALAAPLLHLVGLESGGFHLFGPSGCGKTTSANVGASVWGIPRQQVLNWDATALALANAAAARNDGLMLLDEIGQGNPEAVQQAAYRLFNGTGKMQGAREGGNREMLHWRILVLSTGEVDLASFIQGGGRRARAGQEVRLASLAADAGAGMGAFEGLHGMPDPNHLAKALDRAVNEHFGTVGRSFVAHVAKDMDATAKRLQRAISCLLEDLSPDAGGQVRRVAARFAVVGEALEIATDTGITGWEPGDGRHAIRRCFDDWLDRYGLGNREDQQILEQAEDWFGAHAWSRFIDWEDAKDHDREPDVKNCAGYRKREGDGSLTWLVSPGVFVKEIAEGFDRSAAADTLAKAGMLVKANDGIATSAHKTPDMSKHARRFYKFVRAQRVEGGGGQSEQRTDQA